MRRMFILITCFTIEEQKLNMQKHIPLQSIAGKVWNNWKELDGIAMDGFNNKVEQQIKIYYHCCPTKKYVEYWN